MLAVDVDIPRGGGAVAEAASLQAQSSDIRARIGNKRSLHLVLRSGQWLPERRVAIWLTGVDRKRIGAARNFSTKSAVPPYTRSPAVMA